MGLVKRSRRQTNGYRKTKARREVKPFTVSPPEKKPFVHGIPEGRINKRYDSFPALRAITPDKIRVTPPTAGHVSNIFIKRLFDVGQDVSSFEPTLENNVINAIKTAIPKGILLNSYSSEDVHNPLDKQLQIYTYINLSSINMNLEGIAKLTILCRLSVSHGILTIRNIQKNFEVEEY